MSSSQGAGADAICSARLIVKNSDLVPFEFEVSGRSISIVSLTVVIEAVEHFINSERAFICVYRALSDARDRGRADLVERFTAHLSELVKTTSYTEVIAQIKKEMKLG